MKDTPSQGIFPTVGWDFWLVAVVFLFWWVEGFANLIELQELSLNDNHFEELPDEIFTLKKLRHLSIANNPCSDSPDEQQAIREKMAAQLPKCLVEFP